jgi:hypothetical protein
MGFGSFLKAPIKVHKKVHQTAHKVARKASSREGRIFITKAAISSTGVGAIAVLGYEAHNKRVDLARARRKANETRRNIERETHEVRTRLGELHVAPYYRGTKLLPAHTHLNPIQDAHSPGGCGLPVGCEEDLNSGLGTPLNADIQPDGTETESASKPPVARAGLGSWIGVLIVGAVAVAAWNTWRSA